MFLSGAALTLSSLAQWRPDVLGDGYEMRYVDQPDDYSCQVRSTIIRKLSSCGGNKGVLYVHGFNDYFFQAEMGDRFVDSCYNFYAVDLRKYGRSLLPGQKPFQVRDMKEYFADIDSAIAQMKDDGIDEIILMGHSTGGLTTSLYMASNPDSDIRALILNSPFLDWNLGGSSKYAESVLKQYGGEWDFNTQWKFIVSPDVDAGWIRAIDMGQGMLQNGEDIKIPILLMHSDRSYKKGDDDTQYAVTDAVLDVDDISKYGRRLGWDITEIKVNGGMHDLVLSKKNVREALYDYIFKWLDRQGL